MSWDRRFPTPIEVPCGDWLATLGDAAKYIKTLSNAEQRQHSWQNANQALLQAADANEPIEFAFLSVYQALYPAPKP